MTHPTPSTPAPDPSDPESVPCGCCSGTGKAPSAAVHAERRAVVANGLEIQWPRETLDAVAAAIAAPQPPREARAAITKDLHNRIAMQLDILERGGEVREADAFLADVRAMLATAPAQGGER